MNYFILARMIPWHYYALQNEVGIQRLFYHHLFNHDFICVFPCVTFRLHFMSLCLSEYLFLPAVVWGGTGIRVVRCTMKRRVVLPKSEVWCPPSCRVGLSIKTRLKKINQRQIVCLLTVHSPEGLENQETWLQEHKRSYRELSINNNHLK